MQTPPDSLEYAVRDFFDLIVQGVIHMHGSEFDTKEDADRSAKMVTSVLSRMATLSGYDDIFHDKTGGMSGE